MKSSSFETSNRTEDKSARTALASMAALASVLAACGCCLPVIPFALAAAFAGGSAFLWAARPYLLAASILFIAYGFYEARRMKRCRKRAGRIASLLLWVSALLVGVSILFPQMMANLAASVLAK